MKWISVKDRLPDAPDKYLIVLGTKKHIYIDHWMASSGCWYANDTKSVTHWMPLPEPPKE